MSGDALRPDVRCIHGVEAGRECRKCLMLAGGRGDAMRARRGTWRRNDE